MHTFLAPVSEKSATTLLLSPCPDPSHAGMIAAAFLSARRELTVVRLVLRKPTDGNIVAARLLPITEDLDKLAPPQVSRHQSIY